MKTITFIDDFEFIRTEVVSESKSVFTFLSSQSTDASSIERQLKMFYELRTKSYDELVEAYGYDFINENEPVVILCNDENFVVYYSIDKVLKLAEHNSLKLINSFETSFDEIINFLQKVRDIYLRYEQPETFPIFPNLLALVNKKYAKKLETFGFRVVGQTADMWRFVKDWLIIDLLEDKDGAVLFFTDQRNGQRYEFNMALELLDWDAGNMHALLCQKYQRKMSKDEARTGIMEVTFQYLESHFKGILESLDETFFEKLETERQLRTEMLKKVLSLPKDNLIHQMFVNDNPVWWEYMREDMKN